MVTMALILLKFQPTINWYGPAVLVLILDRPIYGVPVLPTVEELLRWERLLQPPITAVIVCGLWW